MCISLGCVVGGAMDAVHDESINLEGDRLLFPSDLAYYDRCVVSRSPLRWCLTSLWAWCKNRGLRYTFKNWKPQVNKFVMYASLTDQCRWRTVDIPSSAIAPICTTACLIGVLMHMIHQLQRRPALRVAIAHCLLYMSTRVLSH